MNQADTRPVTGASQHERATTLRAQLAATLEDPQRISPALAGVGWLEGDRLVLRLPKGDLKITAPHRLLKRVLKECNGTVSWADLVAAVSESDREEFSNFLQFLFKQGALVDGVRLLAAFAPLGWQGVPVGQEAPEQLTNQIGLVSRQSCEPKGNALSVPSTSLDRLFSQRRSASTFNGAAPTLDAMISLVWSVGGVVSEKHPRSSSLLPLRTVPSAGALYVVEWILVLRQGVAEYGPGVYSVNFPAEKAVRLELIAADVTLLPRSILRPWHLTFATGVLVAVARVEIAELRYRNRALQYLFAEAGAALQNAALVAPSIGLACSVVGGYCEETMERLCHLDGRLVLGSMIFGSVPTEEDEALLKNMPPIDFVWSDSKTEAYPLSFFIARARAKDQSSSDYNTWGKSADPWQAYVKAHAETVERLGMREPRDVVLAPFEGLSDAVPPDAICSYLPEQYQQPGFPFAPFDRTAVSHWVRGVEILSGREAYLPAEFVFRRKYLCRLPSDVAPTLESNSSGCAAGISLSDALLRALLEVIERDAFMRHWLAQMPGRWVPDHALTETIRRRVHALRHAGCETVVQFLDSRAGYVCLVSASQSLKHFTCVAAAARFSAMEAIEGALDECETMVYTRLLGQAIQPLTPDEVDTPEKHAWLYCQKKYYRSARRILTPKSQWVEKLESSEGCLDLMLSILDNQGLRPYYVDLTPKQNCIDQGRTPLTVVKAVVPSLVPITFGFGKEPRGMARRYHPRSLFPHPFP